MGKSSSAPQVPELSQQELDLIDAQTQFVNISQSLLTDQMVAAQQARDLALALSPGGVPPKRSDFGTLQAPVETDFGDPTADDFDRAGFDAAQSAFDSQQASFDSAQQAFNVKRDAELAPLKEINAATIANAKAQIEQQQQLIAAEGNLLPDKVRAMTAQLELYNQNLTLMNMQTQAAIQVEPERQTLLADQIDAQIKQVGVASQQLDLAAKVTDFNANEVFEFTRQNLIKQQSIDETQFANIQLAQTGQQRQQTIFNELLPRNEAFQSTQFDLAAAQQGLTADQISREKVRLGIQNVFDENQFVLAGKEQGLTDQQISFQLNKLNLEASRLGVEERQLAIQSGLFDLQAEELAKEITGGKGLVENTLEGLASDQLALIQGQAGGEVPSFIKNQEAEQIRVLKEQLSRRGIDVTGDTLEELSTGDTVGSQQIEAFKRVAQERRDKTGLQIAGQAQTQLTQTLSALGQERNFRLGLIGGRPGTAGQVAQNVKGVGVVAPGSQGISQGIQPGQFGTPQLGVLNPQGLSVATGGTPIATTGSGLFQNLSAPQFSQGTNPIGNQLAIAQSGSFGFDTSGQLAQTGSTIAGQAQEGFQLQRQQQFDANQQSGGGFGSALGGIVGTVAGGIGGPIGSAIGSKIGESLFPKPAKKQNTTSTA